jgi:FkbM family methyltransferase
MDELAFHRALHRPGLIVDVGAHDGALTLPLAALPGARMVAFEPLPPAFARLEAAVRAAHGGEVPPHIALRTEALGLGAGRLSLDAMIDLEGRLGLSLDGWSGALLVTLGALGGWLRWVTRTRESR